MGDCFNRRTYRGEIISIAEKYLDSCQNKYNHCLACRQQKECRKAWDHLCGKWVDGNLKYADIEEFWLTLQLMGEEGNRGIVTGMGASL